MRTRSRLRVAVLRLLAAAVALVAATTATSCASGPAASPGLAGDPGAAELGCETAPPGFAHGFTSVSGARVHWVRGGRGSPVVLIHGFPETWATWRPVMSLLARRHTVLAVDLPGVGCSSATADGYDTETLAGDLRELTGALGMRRVAVVGHDMGGMTAYAWAQAYPDQVERLVLTGAGIPGFGLEEAAPPHVARFATDSPSVERTASTDIPGFLARFVSDPAVARSGALEAAVRAYSPPGRLAAALGQYRALPQDAAANRARVLGGRLRLETPALALEGGAPGISSSSLRRVGADVRTTVIPGAGHYAQNDRPVAYAAAVEEFLRS